MTNGRGQRAGESVTLLLSLSGSEVDLPEDTCGPNNNNLNITKSVSAPKKASLKNTTESGQ